jgi:MSHA biogenesis protein MshK
MARRLNPLLLALTTLLPSVMPGAAHAQSLRDPTRPPGSVEFAPGESDGGLQSIVRREGRKPLALINGELVPLGGQVGNARLVAVNEDSVVLLDASGHRETLKLTPGVSKTSVKPKPSASRKP